MRLQAGPRSLAGLIAAAVLLSGPRMAVAQTSGTVLRQTMTAFAAAAPTMEIDIAGPKTANTTTKLFLEFGPDGNAATSPPPNPSLPGTVNFRVTASINAAVVNFTPTGGVNTATFPNKIVALTLGDATNAPGFYILSVTHLTSIPAGTTETWRLDISGLPTSLRVMGSVDQGTFRSLTPVGVSQGPGGIRISPPPIPAGTSPTLSIASFSGFDLTGVTAAQVTINPSDGVSNVNVSGVTASSLNLSFALARCARGGQRTLTIRTAAAPFQVTPDPSAPLIGVSPTAVTAGTSSTLTVTSTGCLNLSGVTVAQVSISPNTGISNVAVSNVTATQLNVGFTVASTGPTGARTLTVTAAGVPASASFNVSAPPPPPPPPSCPGPLQRCCETNPDGTVCTLCVTPPQQCP
jgi:hypothetical protein